MMPGKRHRLSFGLSLLAAVASATCAAADEFPVYKTAHFRIYSPLHPQFVHYIELNVEAYYRSMTPSYFPKGFDRPLAIYFLKTQADSRQLLARYGVGDVGYGQYITDIRTVFGIEPALFTHRVMDDGSLSLWGTLFHEITHHFIALNFGNPPAWFNEGLACMLGERTRIVKTRANIGHPNPWRELALKTLIERGLQVDVARVTGFSDAEFYAAPEGYHLARALFFWLFETGKLDNYLAAARQTGYQISTLERTAGMPAAAINRRLIDFINSRCYPAAYLRAAEDASGAAKEQLLQQALAIQSDFRPAQLALAEHAYYDLNDGDRAREALTPLLDDPDSIEYGKALWVMGDTHYSKGGYADATPYHEQALAHADYEERRHWLFYYLGVCAYMTGERAKAKEWFTKFLETDWEPENHPEWISIARRVLAE